MQSWKSLQQYVFYLNRVSGFGYDENIFGSNKVPTFNTDYLKLQLDIELDKFPNFGKLKKNEQ